MRTYSNKFQKNLDTGHLYEKKALKYLEYDSVEHMEGYFKEYDFIITKDNKEYKIEVKSDKQSQHTGNMVIEYECSGKPSGISSTTADFWIYFVVYTDENWKPIKHKVYKIPIEDLKELVNDCRKVRGGDGYRSRMYLLPIKECEKYRVRKLPK